MMFFLLTSFAMRIISQNVKGLINIVSAAVFLEIKKVHRKCNSAEYRYHRGSQSWCLCAYILFSNKDSQLIPKLISSPLS